ncbi:glycosyltransferase family 1 protein [Candidatus Aquiluna sp. UB-MaderosW2red]|uniref:glycosyltransferase family 4 protein n=1 Tax=Candidatus Aquiluna sp. UB-MaderosW2red TaxID=1855377 RepID=UPI000875EB21|nr:glycosyltransferase family 1 protein [Candidatus Aquiluna sp. UB-MaderosW2red]SCX12239.1 Glycosyltransferase involved in cell wall bisynthesis [Candidatus Aquiluna sp. UB-MaderosW2red]
MSGIWFDGRFVKPGKPDGIGQFSLGLAKELAKLTDVTVLVSSKAQADEFEGLKHFLVNSPESPSELTLAFRLRKQNIDVLFSPMQTTSSWFRNFKLVLTLHDLIYYRHRTPPAYLNPIVKLGWWLFHLSYLPQRLVLNKADSVVTVSRTTRNEIVQHRLTKRPIHVVYNAADPVEIMPEGNRHNQRTLIYMGSFIGYKNVETLIQGAGLLKEHKLILLSRISSKRKAELKALANMVGANIEFRNGVTKTEYGDLLASAQALVSASLDEGFGIPLVEAMERGTPIVVSNLEIFREIGQEAALRFIATDPQAFANEVLRLNDANNWDWYSNLALSQAKGFSWERSAQALFEVLQQLKTAKIS